MAKNVKNGVLTTGKVAKICGVSTQTVERWFDFGSLKGFLIPGRTRRVRRIPRQNLIRFMKENSIPMDRSGPMNKKALVIDDDTDVTEQLTRVLAENGFEVMVASSGFEAGVMAENLMPDLILVEYTLPDINCGALLHFMKGEPEFSSTPVIIMSGVVKQDEIERLLKCGADGFVKKPFTDSEIMGKVKDALVME